MFSKSKNVTYKALPYNPNLDPRFVYKNLQEEQKNIHACAKVKDPSKLENRDGITIRSMVKAPNGTSTIVTLLISDSAHYVQLTEEENTISMEMAKTVGPCWDETPSTNTSPRMK